MEDDSIAYMTPIGYSQKGKKGVKEVYLVSLG
jgi:hypothetical protein